MLGRQTAEKQEVQADGLAPVFAETLAEGCTGVLKPSDLHVPHWTEPIHANQLLLRSDRDKKEVREDGDDDIFCFLFLSGSSEFTFMHARTYFAALLSYYMSMYLCVAEFAIQ